MAVRLVPGANGEQPPSRREENDPTSAPVDELTSWLRDLLWALGPVAPGIQVTPCRIVTISGEVGAIAAGSVTVHNRQRSAVAARLSVTPLRGDSGHTWLPLTVDDVDVVVPAGEQRTAELAVFVPPNLPAGVYRGGIVVLGAVGDDLELHVDVSAVEVNDER
ncbi:MAG: hypothetical protein AAFP84_04710 [Actinomycetota bacterium]